MIQVDVIEYGDLLTVAINYAIRRQNSGELKYTKEAILLYRWGFDKRVLFENGVLSSYSYKNTLQLALKIEDFDWAEKFINDFKPFLPEKDRENLYKYNLAIFHFRKNDYQTAMMLLLYWMKTSRFFIAARLQQGSPGGQMMKSCVQAAWKTYTMMTGK